MIKYVIASSGDSKGKLYVNYKFLRSVPQVHVIFFNYNGEVIKSFSLYCISCLFSVGPSPSSTSLCASCAMSRLWLSKRSYIPLLSDVRLQKTIPPPLCLVYSPVDVSTLDNRLHELKGLSLSTAYSKQKLSLKNELESFLFSLPGHKSLSAAMPIDVRRFLAWKDKDGKVVRKALLAVIVHPSCLITL